MNLMGAQIPGGVGRVCRISNPDTKCPDRALNPFTKIRAGLWLVGVLISKGVARSSRSQKTAYALDVTAVPGRMLQRVAIEGRLPIRNKC